MAFVIGVDLGATKIAAAVADPDGQVLSQAEAQTRAHEGPEAGLHRITGVIVRAMALAGVDPREMDAIGIGAPGILDRERGVIVDAIGLQWRNVRLREVLEARFGTRVALMNDATAGGLGEHRYGAGQGVQELLYVNVGTGIGGCIISRGRVHHGANGNAGEVGHMVVAMDGPLCVCGARGCVGAISSGRAIARAGQDLALSAAGARVRELAGGNPSAVDGSHVARAALEGDPAATEIIARAARALGLAVGGLMNTLGPERVVLGGGVTARLGGSFVKAVAAAAQAQALKDCWAPVVPAELGAGSALKGAVALALETAGERVLQ